MYNFTIPANWRLVSIGELATIIYGKSLGKDKRKKNGNYPVYGSGGIMGYTDIPLHSEDSIILGRKGTVGSIYFSETPFWCIDTAFYIKNISSVIQIEYLAFALRMIDLRRLSIVVGVPGINRKDIEKQRIPLPTLPEQKAIVEILQQAEKLKELRKKVDIKAKKLLQSIFNQMFAEPEEDWITCKLKDVIDLKAGKNVAGQSYPAQRNKWGILKISAVTTGEFLVSENKELLDKVEPNSKNQVNQGDLLVTRLNTPALIGASAIVEQLNQNLLLPDNIWRVIIGDDFYINKRFLYSLLNSPKIRHEIRKRAMGTSSSMNYITQPNFLSIEVQLPSQQKQLKFETIAQGLRNELLEKQQEVSEKIDALLSNLQIQAFTGKLTESFRQKEQFAITSHAKLRDATLQIKSASDTVHQLEQILEVSGNLVPYLSEQQQAILDSLAVVEGYAIADNDFSDLDLPPNQIQRNLDLLAEIGLIKAVNIPVAPGEIGRVFYTPAYRTLSEADNTQMTDLEILEKQATA